MNVRHVYFSSSWTATAQDNDHDRDMKVNRSALREIQRTDSQNSQFGKQILAQRVPGWSQYYLDYKALKKIVSSLASGRSLTESPSLALGPRPPNPPTSSGLSDVVPSVQAASLNLQDQQALEILNASGRDEDRGPNFQAHKVAFFFKLERELEKVCGEMTIY